MSGVEPEEATSISRVDASTNNHNHHDLHAHFKEEEEDVLEAHDSVIPVEPIGNGRVKVRLGFLQVLHVYEVRFSILDQLGQDVTFDPLENLHVKIESASPTEDGKGHNLVVTFRAVKEKLMQETVTISSCGDDQTTTTQLGLVLCARVLGKGKGTPALKKGIHLLSIEGDEDSEGSDWQGF